MNQLPKQKSHSWPSRNSQISDAKNKKQKNKQTNKQPTPHNSPYHFCLCCDPNKGFNFFFFLNQRNAVGTMEGKCTQKTETGARLCPGRASEAGLTEQWLAHVGTCIPSTILPPRPLGGSTVSLHLQSVQHLRDEIAHTKVRNCNRDSSGPRWGPRCLELLGRGKAKGCPTPVPLMSFLIPGALTKS